MSARASEPIRLKTGLSGVPECFIFTAASYRHPCFDADCWDGRVHSHCLGGPSPHVHDMDDPALVLVKDGAW